MSLNADLAAQRQPQQLGDRLEVASAGQMAAHGASPARVSFAKNDRLLRTGELALGDVLF
jgi:hypothetical protein